MCCLFGFYNYSGQPIKNLGHLTNCLAEEATVRGTDATGIAYNHKGKLIINKEPKSAFQIDFKHPDDIVSVTGHTRHSTQGNKNKNYNNHPFSGHCKNVNFALAHNGVLTNDLKLRKELRLPHTKIETDSFIAVQLIEKKKVLGSESIKFMAEKIKGSFAFSILDTDNTLWLVRGDSPLSLIRIPISLLSMMFLLSSKKYLKSSILSPTVTLYIYWLSSGLHSRAFISILRRLSDLQTMMRFLRNFVP